jgi:Carboxypeptidase regulatory-like domain/TonB-dependent Receptor Plug Domain
VILNQHRKVRSSLLCALSMFAVTVLLAGVARAQLAGGTVQGTVTDKSGAAIAKAQVSIKNTDTGVSRDVETNEDGFYSAPNLLPGNYDIRMAASGFVDQLRTGLTLNVGATQVIDVVMQVSGKVESVEVTAVTGQVESASSSISQVVNATTVRELPLNGRSWTDLATLEPGVSDTHLQPQFNGGRGQRGYGTQISISGSRPDYNNYRLDGVSVNDYANAGPGNVLGAALGVDAIQEFSLSSSTYSAEYGRTAGGVVNAITKSGTNEFHGDVYEFLRNSALDTRNYFDGSSVPEYRRNQFGGSVGGPILKDRTFFFVDYEGLRESLGQTTTDVVLTPAALAGNLSTGTVTPDPTVVNFYNAFFPAPNGPAVGADTAKFIFAATRKTTENFLTARVDHKFSSSDSFSGTYMFDNAMLTQPDEFNNILNSFPLRRQLWTLEETHIFSSQFLNVARFGYNRPTALVNGTATAINQNATDTSFGAVPGRAAPDVRVTGLTEFTGGVGGPASYDFHFNSFQFYDDAFLSRGAHSLKFGFNVERIQDNITAVSDGNGLFRFPSLAAFLQNQPNRFDSAFPQTISGRGLRQTIFGAYVQDDWRFRPNLTFNIGVRYETATVPTDAQDKLSVLRNISDPTPHLGSPYFSNPTHYNFEPRVGFSWDPFHDGKTAIRGAFGLYDVLPLVDEFNLVAVFTEPFFEQGFIKTLPQGSFVTGAFPLLSSNNLRQNYITPNPGRNYVMQYNLNVQRALGKDLSLMVGYVGSRGIRNPFRADDVDLVLPVAKTAEGYIWPNPIGSGTVVNPNFGDIRGLLWEGHSYYDSLQFLLNKLFSHGLQAQASFTYSRSIDTSSGTVAGDPFSNSITSLPWFDLRIGRGPSDFNIPKNLVLNFTWELPKPKLESSVANWAAGGWQIGGIFRASDGLPFTMVFGGDPLGNNSSDPWDWPDVVKGPGCSSLVNPGNPNNYVKTQCFTLPPVTPDIASLCDTVHSPPGACLNLFGNEGRNRLKGPGMINLDFSVFKNNKIERISPTFNVQFRAEIFNILNHANFAPPLDNNAIFDGSGNPVGGAGLIDSTVTSSRQVQFALKVIW